MSISFLLLALQSGDPIVVTGSREPMAMRDLPGAISTIEDRGLEAIDLPGAADTLRLLPGVSVSVSGPRGTQTQVRLRGAEANHTLLFLDGIRLNDPAAGNEARFELLNTDLISRIELVPGAQSALWGPEALGGVISVESPSPLRGSRAAAIAEYGSLDSLRRAGPGSGRAGDCGRSARGSGRRSDGIDSCGAGGERDGFETASAAVRAAWRPTEGAELGASGLYVEGRSDFDGFDPVTFRRADTADATENRIAAGRFWGALETGGWTFAADADLLDSANRNLLGDAPLNRTAGRRTTAGGQVSRRIGGHRVTAAIEHEAEEFAARDTIYFGGTDQDRARHLTALVGEWNGRWSDRVTTNLAIRRDSFSAFADSTNVRAAVLVRPAREWTLLASYGEGIAQPSFYDLYGFFPGSFVGNPALRPEQAQSWEAAVQWRHGPTSLRLTGFTSRLESEIVDVFDPASFLSSTRNVEGKSRRRGIEFWADHRVSRALELSFNYTFLDADERREPTDAPIREVRRPRHSANLVAFGESGRLRWSATAAYVGARTDMDFDLFPAARIRLGDYVLASARLGWRLTEALEAFGRIENAFGADYQDVVGYNTPGRTVHAGLRLRLGD